MNVRLFAFPFAAAVACAPALAQDAVVVTPVVPDAVSLESDHGSVSEPDPPQGDRLG